MSEQDRRARELSLTAKGHKIRSALESVVKDLQKDILQALSETEQAVFIQLARKVIWQTGTSAAN